MNKTVAIASARQAPSTAPSDDVITKNTAAKMPELIINLLSLAQLAAALVPVPLTKSLDARSQQRPPGPTRHARAPATAKSQKSRRPFRAPDKCSAASTPPGSDHSSAAPRKPSS